MIEIDYGKEAYVKLQQLDKYVKNLEKEQNECNYNELIFNLGSDSNITNFETSFKVEAFKSGKYYFHFNMLSNLVSIIGVIVKVYANDVICFSLSNSLDVDFSFIAEPTLVKGENTIKVVMFANNPFNLEYLIAKVNGFLDYSKVDNRLSILNYNDKDYILFLNQKTAEIYTYDYANKLRYFRLILNVKDACLLFVNELFLFLATIGENDSLTVRRINISTLSVEDFPLDVSGVTSVAGFHTSEGIKLYFCKLYNLYEGVFKINGNVFNCFNTNKKAVKVYADASAENCYVIKDRYDKCSFINENANLINVNSGDKFHLLKTDNGYNLEFNSSNKLLSQEIVGLKTSEVQTVDYCEERVKLYDGKYLIRNRDVISVQ